MDKFEIKRLVCMTGIAYLARTTHIPAADVYMCRQVDAGCLQ